MSVLLRLGGGFYSSDYGPNRLQEDTRDTLTEEVMLAPDTDDRPQGLVVGRSAADTIAAAVRGAGNTGNGALSAHAIGGALAMNGTYRATARTAGATASWEVWAPDGSYVGRATTGTAFSSRHINFTIADGSNNWAVGDRVSWAVSGAVWRACVAGAVDGSGDPRGILIRDVPGAAGSAEIRLPVAVAGRFDPGSVLLEDGHTVEAVRLALIARGIRFLSAVAAEEGI